MGKPNYLVESTTFYGDVEAIVAYLEAKLVDGWVLIAVEGTTFYFKATI